MTSIPPAEIWSLETTRLGQRVHVHDRLDSTNTLALSLAHAPSNHGLVVLAREQNAGRGQYGRTWHAPAGSSVLMSLLLFPPTPLRRPALLTAWAAVSVCEAVLKLANLQAKIKWPNDVLVRGKKICGILIEQRTTGNAESPLASVVGIGLNITQTAAMFEQAQLPDAGALAMFAEQPLAFDEVAKTLIRELDAQYANLLAGDSATLESLWKWRLGLLGKMVLVEGIHQTTRGRLVDVTLDGIDLDIGGEIVRTSPESVRHIYAD
ncbi:MAG TPA: biotin--[acetyl-CoA-carboxylase] ligase [Gemmataceae bacterium]|nr:biotin--[acetyl-CoA-carboxylase] ligase [Gemmataceae bacterium]